MVDEKKVAMGKKSKAQGGVFELRVRKDLEDKGWIVAKWTNNVEFEKRIKDFSICEGSHPHTELEIDGKKTGYHMEAGFYIEGKLIPAKAAYGFNPRLKMMVPLTRSTGFPDFVCFKRINGTSVIHPYKIYDVIGVESKLTGDLTKEEKEKCKWLLENNIFSKILIARKTKVKNRVVIVYEDFKEKYWRFYK